MTARQRQSQRIMREKAAQKKRQALMRKVYVVGGAAACMGVIALAAWCWQNSVIGRLIDGAVDEAYAMTADAGFAVESLYLDGRVRTSMDEINKAMNIEKGDPILRISLEEVRTRLENIESISHATVERALPDKMYVHIVEREPVALWQNNGRIALVDDNGVVMTGLDMEPYRGLPLIIGSDAPTHVREVIALLAAQPDLARRFSAAIRVGERRWNIRISNRENEMVEVKLPEDRVREAWDRLAALQADEQVLDRDIKEIDLRLEGRMFIKLAPGEIPVHKRSNARDA